MENVSRPIISEDHSAALRLIEEGIRARVIRADELEPHLKKLGLSSETIGKLYAQLWKQNVRVIPIGASAQDPDQAQQLQELLEQRGQRLTERERQILMLRFAEGKSQAEAAAQEGVTRERIRQIENMAIHKLVRPDRRRSKKIRDFYE